MTKPVIVTRAGKGSALTWTEGDANLTNLRDATLTLKAGTGGTDVVSDLNGTVTLVAGTNVTLSGDNTAKTITINASGGSSGLSNIVEDTTPQLGGNLDVNGQQIVSTSNGNIVLAPNGTGKVRLSGLDWPPTPPASGGGFSGNVTSVDGSLERLYVTNAINISLGGQITFAGGDVPDAGLSTSASYWVINVDDVNGWIQISDTEGGSAKDLTTLAMPGDFTWNTGGGTPTFSGGEVLTYSTSAMGLVWAQPSSSLSTLSDVNITGVSNGQVLVYNSTSTKWVNTTLGSSGLENIVEDTTPELGGNLDLKDFKIVNSGGTGSINIEPSSYGNSVYLRTPDLQVGNSTGTTQVSIYPVGTQTLALYSDNQNSSAIVLRREGQGGHVDLNPGTSGLVRTSKSILVQSAGEVRFGDSDSSNYVGFKAPATVSTDKIWTLPAADGSNGQVLSTNGAGILAWATAGGGGNSYAVLEANTNYTTINAGTGTLNPGWTEASDINGIVSNTSTQFTLGTGTYLITLSSAGMLASGSVSSNTKANTGGIYFDVYSVTASSTLHRYYQEATQFWTGSSTSFEIGMGPVFLQGIVTPSVSTTYEIRFNNTGLQKQFNNWSSPGKSFRIVIIKLA